jgi:hypothetical protein
MPLQDLTPQLRTRLNRMERGVGWFVFLAAALLLFGFGYYLYHTAAQRGWFAVRAKFHVYVQSSTGLKVGDPITIMGFSVGQITDIYPMPPQAKEYVRVEFQVYEPFFRYIWSEGSYVKITPVGYLDQREIEVTRGTNGYEICLTQPVTVFTNLDVLKADVDKQTNRWQLAQEIYDEHSNLLYRAYTWLDDSNLQRIAALKLPSVTAYNDREANKHHVVAWWHPREHAYGAFKMNEDTAWLPVMELPPVADRLQGMISEVQNAMPDILTLTNQLKAILANGALATSNLNITVMDTQPLLTNATLTVVHLDTNVNNFIVQMGPLITNANLLVANLNTNVTATLMNLADISSNLNVQVQRNANMLGGTYKTITDYDAFVLGLERHWLLRSAFKKVNKSTNAPPPALKLPKQSGLH